MQMKIKNKRYKKIKESLFWVLLYLIVAFNHLIIMNWTVCDYLKLLITNHGFFQAFFISVHRSKILHLIFETWSSKKIWNASIKRN